jgi:diadenosine tetraphosphatase ApaH/serine/threonine PP2A family protein phosphatase
MGQSAIISDIHSNLHALQAVLEVVDAEGCDEILCLGDIAGYGAQPAEVVDLIRSRRARCIQGNHDSLITLQNEGRNYSPPSLLAAEHNRRLLDREALEFLAGLPLELEVYPGTLLFHGSPDYQDSYLINSSQLKAASDEVYLRMGGGLCFFGHTHMPTLFAGQCQPYAVDEDYPLPTGLRVLVNPGSVGQPRDGDPRSSFAIWEREARVLRFKRVQYDVEGARQAILDQGLPEILGDRLLSGR